MAEACQRETETSFAVDFHFEGLSKKFGMFCGNNYSRAVTKSEVLLISSIIVVLVFMSVDKIGRASSMRVMALLTLFSFFSFSTNFMLESSWARQGAIWMSQIQVFKNAYSNFMTSTYKESISKAFLLTNPRQKKSEVPQGPGFLLQYGSIRHALFSFDYICGKRLLDSQHTLFLGILPPSSLYNVLCLRLPPLLV